MREIKFRAWWPSRKEMTAPMTLADIATSGSDTIPAEIIFMQFTGLNDKNGVEIYEGDIIDRLQYWNEEIRVMSPKYRFVVKWLATKQRLGWNIGKGKGDRPRLRVIGNIYENPELLKESA